MKPRRILYVARQADGGSAEVLYRLAVHLDKNRYEPVVLFYHKNSHILDKFSQARIKTILLQDREPARSSGGSAETVKGRDIAGWLEHRLGRRVSEAYIFLKAGYYFLRREASKILPIMKAIRQHQINLVHVNNGLYRSKPGIIAARLAGVPCVCHVHMFQNLSYFDRLFAGLVNAYLYISQAIADNYTTQGIHPAQGAIIHNGIDTNQFSHPPDAGHIRDEFAGNGASLVGVVGRLVSWKGHEYFIQAVAKLKPQFPNLKGLIIGPADASPVNQQYLQKLHQLTAALELKNDVIFTGFRDDVLDVMSALDVVVHSSSEPEPFGLVIIEGMALGKPVVATAAGGVLDIVEDKVSGLLVPCQDAGAMAQAILWLLTHQKQAEQMGRRAYRRVTEKFTMQRQTNAVQQIYDDVIHNSTTLRPGV